MPKHGVSSGSLPAGYCSRCLPSFKEGLKYSKNPIEYVYSKQLQGRYGKCSKCGYKESLYYPIKLHNCV